LVVVVLEEREEKVEVEKEWLDVGAEEEDEAELSEERRVRGADGVCVTEAEVVWEVEVEVVEEEVDDDREEGEE
jgi:hypothetical protein